MKVKQVKDAEDGVEYCLARTSSNTIIVAACIGSDPAQSWYKRAVGQIESATIVEAELCFEAASMAASAAVTLETCDDNNDHQGWDIVTQPNGFDVLRSMANPSYCVDHNDIGSEVVLWQCDTSEDQSFSKTFVSDTRGDYFVPSNNPSEESGAIL